MSYPAYESYKDSGVEWLGEVPTNWSILALKRHCSIYNGSTPKSGDPQNWNGKIPWATPRDLSKNKSSYISETDRNITNDGFHSSNLTLLRKNSIILSTRAPIGHIAINRELMTFNQGCRGIETDDFLYSKYAYYLLFSAKIELNVLGNGTTFIELDTDSLSSLKIVIPSILEQKAIVTFLDEKTAAIDDLIAKKEKLLELLAEKRTALITQAVTKGLDPSAPMKPSGIDWLGEVPKEWQVKKLKYLSSANDETLPETSDVNFGIIYVDISSVDLIEGIQQKEEMTFSDAPSRARRVVKHGDTIVSTVRTYLKAIAAIKQPEKNLIVSTGFCVVRPSEMIDPDYLGYCLRSEGFVGEVVSKSVGVSYPAINPDGIMSIKIICPPLNEQKIIANYLCQSLIDLDAIKIKIIGAISALKEYRTALITNAVTGKIKVI